LLKESREAMKGFEPGELQFVIAGLNTTEGRALADRYRVGKVTLLLSSPLTKSVSSDSICSSSFMRKLTDVDEATVCGSGRPYRGVV
jgi:hypothetical protein